MVQKKVAQSITISSERDAFAYLQRALKQEISTLPLQLEFDNWPVIQIRLDGPGYKSTITSDMAEALVEFQRAMDRAYARLVHHSPNARKLTNQERREIAFKAKVKNGSSVIEINLGDYAEKLALSLADKMTPEQLIMMVVGVAAVGGSVVAYKSFLKARSEDKKVAEESRRAITLSQEETKRMELMASVVSAVPALKHVGQDFDAARHEIVRSTADAKSLTVSGVALDGESARVIAMGKRSESTDVQLNGSYLIRKVDWQHGREVRLTIANDEHGVFSASLQDDTLQQSQIKLIEAAEWGRSTVYLSINGTKLRGEITKAVIIGVREHLRPAAGGDSGR